MPSLRAPLIGFWLATACQSDPTPLSAPLSASPPSDAPWSGEALDQDDAMARRLLEQSFTSILERYGPVSYRGQSRIRIDRNGHEMDLQEKTQIETTKTKDLRIRQWDRDGAMLREALRVQGQWYVRHGRGALRKADYIQNRHLQVHDEAFSALAGVARTLGPGLALQRAGRSANGVAYRILPGSGTPPDPALTLDSLEGRLEVEERTGIPRSGSVQAKLRVSGEERPGTLELSVQFELRPGVAEPFDVSDAVEPIQDRSVRHDPLAFLRGETETSTVIGGR